MTKWMFYPGKQIRWILTCLLYFSFGAFISFKSIKYFNILNTKYDIGLINDDYDSKSRKEEVARPALPTTVGCVVTYYAEKEEYPLHLHDYHKYVKAIEKTWLKQCDSKVYARLKIRGEIPPKAATNSSLLNAYKQNLLYDYILFTDIKNIIFIANLKEYLRNENKNDLNIYGFPKLIKNQNGYKYVVEGALVLSMPSLKFFVDTFSGSGCDTVGMPDSEELSECMLAAGLSLVDTRDKLGKLTFLPGYSLEALTTRRIPSEYNIPYEGRCMNLKCASDFPISMSQLYSVDVYLIYFVYDKCARKKYTNVHTANDVRLEFNGALLTDIVVHK